MPRQYRIAFFAAAVLLLETTTAAATPTITIDYTTDNGAIALYYRQDGGPLVDISGALGPNACRWEEADTLIFDAAFAPMAGSHDWEFIWQAVNVGFSPPWVPTPPAWNNPGAFLAQITFAGFTVDPGTILSGANGAWSVASDLGGPWSNELTAIAANGTPPWFWFPIATIDPAAQWIWDADNQASTLLVRASFSTTAPVPEPGTLLLAATGLGVLLLRRRFAVPNT